MKQQQLAWSNPLEFAAQLSDGQFVLLYSGVKTAHSGRYSYLACGLREEVKAEDFTQFSAVLSDNNEKFTNAWFGYLGYGLKNSLENLTIDKESWVGLPDLWMMHFGKIYVFDHELQIVTLFSDEHISSLRATRSNPENKDWIATSATPPRNDTLPAALITTSNMSDGEYLQKVATIIEKINAGELYQANLTRKFYGEFSETPDAFTLFKKLCAASPAAFSAFIKLGDTAIISSSPELFLNIDESGKITTRPIKGTAKRSSNKTEDETLKNALKNSEKDRAENLMIVDLMRNDLAKTCEAGSITTEALFDITTHATIHHLSSTISGKKSRNYSTLDTVKAAFPAGSMTGAPKIRAMGICSDLEGDERGVYSGAIGWFGGDGSCDLSVVIRTIILRGNKFEFQVGGGIVADSTPEGELQETFTKSRGILLALGLDEWAIEQGVCG